MIEFELASKEPKPLADIDWRVLGQKLGRALNLKKTQTIGLKFVTQNKIQELNQRYRGLDRPTDVLSFENATVPGATDQNISMGDIVICSVYATTHAREKKIDPMEELVRLVIHGSLHLAGYDHAKPAEAAKMFLLQEKILCAALQ